MITPVAIATAVIRSYHDRQFENALSSVDTGLKTSMDVFVKKKSLPASYPVKPARDAGAVTGPRRILESPPPAAQRHCRGAEGAGGEARRAMTALFGPL